MCPGWLTARPSALRAASAHGWGGGAGAAPLGRPLVARATRDTCARCAAVHGGSPFYNAAHAVGARMPDTCACVCRATHQFRVALTFGPCVLCFGWSRFNGPSSEYCGRLTRTCAFYSCEQGTGALMGGSFVCSSPMIAQLPELTFSRVGFLDTCLISYPSFGLVPKFSGVLWSL